MTSFFARPVRVFGSVAVVVLCCILFLTPFSVRGARLALQRMENNIKDWLPADFSETKDLEWFGRHFAGERFAVITWPGCNESDARFELLVKKLKAEVKGTEEAELAAFEASLARANADDNTAETDTEILTISDTDEPSFEIQEESPEDQEMRRRLTERVRARQMGDRLGLYTTGDYHLNWGGLNEKWLGSVSGQWYYITPDGELYEWSGKANFPSATYRFAERKLTGTNRTTGTLAGTAGLPATDSRPNEFYTDPRKLTARFFKSIQTGPELIDELAVDGGPLWPRLDNVAEEDKPAVARETARDRLTGTLFGPATPEEFNWTASAVRELLSEEKLAEMPEDWAKQFNSFVADLVESQYDGRKENLLAATTDAKSDHWEAYFASLGIEPPLRQTSIVVTLSEVGKQDLALVLGRGVMGRPYGKLLDLAINECNLAPAEIRMGGPPVDNVAIDEEGMVTLARLIVPSAAVGLLLSFLCFRSIKVTCMVFFVGGVSAVTSVALVYWIGQIPSFSHLSSVDAVLMSMPSLIYVLGLSGAIHIVNYYRESVHEHGLVGAPERALGHGWGPCTLAAFTTALGLISLVNSNLTPIKKFGLFSAIGVMLTLLLLFTYLPAALQIWPPGYEKRSGRSEAGGLAYWVERFWIGVGHLVIRRYAIVSVVFLAGVFAIGLGLGKIKTSVQLLKLFASDAKIIQDYAWLEDNFGKLVPMEVIARVRPEMMQPSSTELETASEEEKDKARFGLSFLERMEVAARIQHWLELEFGEKGRGKVGHGLSAATFAPDLPPPSRPSPQNPIRWAFDNELSESRDEILAAEYLRIDDVDEFAGSELWRVSLRLGALSNVDYGEFLHEQKLVVEPILTSYRLREEILRKINEQREDGGFVKARIGFIGPSPTAASDEEEELAAARKNADTPIDQTRIFSSTLKDLMAVAGCYPAWVDPDAAPEGFFDSETWESSLKACDCVVLVADHPQIDVEFVKQHAKTFIDARDHVHVLGADGSLTARERDDSIHVVYTGAVPVVYKAQRTLLESLVSSIGMAFVMIAGVMMILLRDWKRPLGPFNLVNVSAGIISMIPNLFPVLLIFGAMGHLGVEVDIGTMMCASVAMGVAVDDTIHFLTWFRTSVRQGMTRNEAVIEAYRRVGTAMTQTTLIGGLGLAVFAFSRFTPTQRFGIMMVALLAAALIGDLILLPALLASPLGRLFVPKSARKSPQGQPVVTEPSVDVPPAVTGGQYSASTEATTPHSSRKEDRQVRRDARHG